MEEHHLQFNYTARYYRTGSEAAHPKRLVFALHGYGQLAKYFIRKFDGLDGDTTVIVPEGLSRFYLQGFDGRIGATWMTREDRLTDIKNYISYLNELYATLTIKPTETMVSVVGFSQGAATASRWLADGKIHFDQFILWAGIFPPDMDNELAAECFHNKQIDYVYGTSDTYITDKRLMEMKRLSDQLCLTPRVTTFDGDHAIDPETLSKVLIHHR